MESTALLNEESFENRKDALYISEKGDEVPQLCPPAASSTAKVLIIVVLFILYLFTNSQRHYEFPEQITSRPQNISINLCEDGSRRSVNIDPLTLCSLEKDDCPRLFSRQNVTRRVYKISARYNLANCLIPKSMSTTMLAVMCYLHKPDEFKQLNRSIRRETWGRSICKMENQISRSKLAIKYPNSKKFAIVRDPFARFVSGYVHRCLKDKYPCYGCNEDLECFVQRLYENLMQLSRQYGTPEDEDAYHHFAPQSWYCSFKNDLYNTRIFKLGASVAESSSMFSELEKFFSEQGVPEDEIKAVGEVIRGGGTKSHDTHSRPETGQIVEKMKSNPELMRLFIKMYYFDYVIFGFKFPEIKTI